MSASPSRIHASVSRPMSSDSPMLVGTRTMSRSSRPRCAEWRRTIARACRTKPVMVGMFCTASPPLKNGGAREKSSSSPSKS